MNCKSKKPSSNTRRVVIKPCKVPIFAANKPFLMKNFALLTVFLLFGWFSCGNDKSNSTALDQTSASSLQSSALITPDTIQPGKRANKKQGALKGFRDMQQLDSSIQIDIKYATTDNFTHSQIYDCPRCFLRPDAAEAIVKAHQNLQKKGLGLKMFDCYRPRPYQQRLWDKVPNPDYVTPPAKGSMHSRGAAVDLTIVDANGKELDMGTPYDFFGPEAHTDNTKLPQKVLDNRRLLRETLEALGFKGIRTEWWHFSYQKKNYPLSDDVWPCKE
jgi:zinc D-Ala-D-Ala dipeptidase